MGSATYLLLLCCLYAASAVSRKPPPAHYFFKLPPPQVPLGRDTPVQGWHTQKLTHFDDGNTATWNQQYWTNKQVYQEGGPIFIMLGGEGPAGPGWLQAGHMFDMAEEHGAMLLLLEHRFYGDSKPTPDCSVDSLQYLSGKEALADAAEFLRDFKAKNPEFKDSRVITFGGSYPANLASWMRVIYPDDVWGSVASSGPVELELDFYQYLEVVSASMERESKECVDAVRSATTTMTELLSQPNGAQNLSETFYLCETLDLDNKLDVANFFSIMGNEFSGAVQYNGSSGDSIGNLCYYMTNTDYGTPMQRLSTVVGGSSSSCVDAVFQNMVDYYGKDMSWNGYGAQSQYLQWLYQTCSNFGYYQTGNSDKQPFSKNFLIDMYLTLCTGIYGDAVSPDKLRKAISDDNVLYGSLMPDTTNVVHVHGSTDPWHALGITQDVSNGVHGILIDGTSHCFDMYSDTPGDLPGLTEARKKIRSYVAEWLSQ